MTTTSLEVGSVFTITDRASPVIDRLARQLGDFAAAVANCASPNAGFGRSRELAGGHANAHGWETFLAFRQIVGCFRLTAWQPLSFDSEQRKTARNGHWPCFR
jgi:hypothetical protein